MEPTSTFRMQNINHYFILASWIRPSEWCKITPGPWRLASQALWEENPQPEKQWFLCEKTGSLVIQTSACLSRLEGACPWDAFARWEKSQKWKILFFWFCCVSSLLLPPPNPRLLLFSPLHSATVWIPPGMTPPILLETGISNSNKIVEMESWKEI